jgi:hypothetical protein
MNLKIQPKPHLGRTPPHQEQGHETIRPNCKFHGGLCGLRQRRATWRAEINPQILAQRKDFKKLLTGLTEHQISGSN